MQLVQLLHHPLGHFGCYAGTQYGIIWVAMLELNE